ncbi:hypothetical protein [Campylobacter gastrosuis]|uniref:Phage tail tape measure protein n=1 Tax=Campylobacter gastrosuis TaxID=2974576 RepID=A0ABT7HMP0_9BACT|nr:hypothetical protein [Campylobacter gastrosuis]MDL0088164.1 hypothetical protein [Campylobacter gastrosuis]
MANNDVNIKIVIGASTYEVKAARKDVNELGKSLSNTDTIANALNSSFGKIALSLGVFTGAAIKIKDIAKSGIEANRVFENLKIQLTGLIAANSSNISTLGNAINTQQKWRMGLKESEKILKELNTTNQRTKFSLSEIAESFNMFYATSANQGDKDKAVVAMDSIALAAQAVGKDLKALTPMMDSLATGTVVAASEMGSFMKIVGLTNEELKKANESGKLYDYLIEKLANFKELSGEAAKSYDVALGGLKNELSDILKELSKPLFDRITSSLSDFTNFIKENREWLTKYFRHITDGIEVLAKLALAFGAVKLSAFALSGMGVVIAGFKTVFVNSLTASLVATAALSRGLNILNTAFKTLLPTATIYLIYEAKDAIKALNKGLDSGAQKLNSVQQWIYRFLDAFATQLQIAQVKIYQFINDIKISGLKAKEFFAELNDSYNIFSSGDSAKGIKKQINLLTSENEALQGLIEGYKKASVERELSLQGFKNEPKELESDGLKDTIKPNPVGVDQGNVGKTKDILKLQQGIYKDYYEQIGDYGKAWAIRELELREQLKNANINAFDTSSIINLNKDEYFKRVNEERKQKAIEALNKELELEDRKSQLRRREAELIDTNTTKTQTLLSIEYEKTLMQYNAMLEREQITQEYYDKAIALEEQLYQKQLFDASSWGQVMQSGLSSLESSMMSFFDYSSDRFLKFGDVAKSVLNDIYKALVRELIISQIISAIRGAIGGMMGGGANEALPAGGMPQVLNSSAQNTNYVSGSGLFAGTSFANRFATGGILNSPDLHQYVNKVVSKPTYFKFASGGVPSLGVMGEKNGGSPEAIMPLTRTKNGDLGVRVQNENTPNNVKIEVINQTKEDVKVTNVQTRQNLEEQVISIVINAVTTNKSGMRDIMGGSR